MNIPVRIGCGFDVHRFSDEASDDAFITLGGVRIPHTHRLLAHSDGDVLVHALCDALLGALALGDIGRHFPDTDRTFSNIDSTLLLKHVMGLIVKAGWQLGNADMTIIVQAPRISPHVQAMRERLASLMKSQPEYVSVKATTTEKLGFTGRGEGIACQAQVLLVHSDSKEEQA